MPKKISIITPSYNQGHFIEKTILSVINQEYPDFEYIIIDGNSTDETINIIKKYENNIDYWISEADTGQTHAINKGLKKANGDIITYINSDDVYVKGAFHKVVKFFDENPGVGIVYGDVQIIDQHSRVLRNRKEIAFDLLMAKLIGFGILIPQPATFWRKEVTEKIGLFDETNNFTMDQDYWYRASKYFKIKHIPEILAQFRIHEQSKTNINLSQKNTAYYKHHLKDLERFYNELPISNIIPFKYSYLIRYPYRVKRIIKKFILGKYFG